MGNKLKMISERKNAQTKWEMGEIEVLKSMRIMPTTYIKMRKTQHVQKDPICKGRYKNSTNDTN